MGCAHQAKLKPNTIESRRNQTQILDRPYVVLVSIDGFRNDYVDRYSAPTLKSLRTEGVYAEGLLPVFPSKTFPNHYSIVTGLYAENHGIVSNIFWDPVTKRQFKFFDPNFVREEGWFRGEPIWVTAEKQGMLSAVYLWPGSEAKIQGILPTYYYHFTESQNATPQEKADQVRRWLELPEDLRPHFIAVYLDSKVDSMGHRYGPDAKETADAVASADQAVSYLLTQLKQISLPIHVFITSDHGMQAIGPDWVEYLDDVANLKGFRVEGDGPVMLLYAENPESPETPKKVDALLRKLRKGAKHFQVYRRKEMPKRLHFSKNVRIGDLIVIADAPYSVLIRNRPLSSSRGNHGFDSDRYSSMHGIFYAVSPCAKKGAHLPPFRNIHIQPMINQILKISSGPVDGSPEVLESLFKESCF